MGHNLRGQVGKTNTSGNGNYVTQTGQINQNNSNNTTIHQHYHNNDSSQQDNSAALLFILFGGVILILALMAYYLFRYSDYIVLIIEYGHIILLAAIYAIYRTTKIDGFDSMDSLNFLLILGIGLLSFYWAVELFSMKEVIALSQYAKETELSQFWQIDIGWKVKSIYFLINSILIIILLAINIYFSISFTRYSLGCGRQGDLVLIAVFSILFFILYYFSMIDPDWLNKFIGSFFNVSIK